MLRKTLTILSLLGLLLSVGLSALTPITFANLSAGGGGGWSLVPSNAGVFWRLGVPFWISTLFFAAVSWYFYAPLYRSRKRAMLGLCVKCGYDLRGLTEARCPECNTSFDERLLKKDA